MRSFHIHPYPAWKDSKLRSAVGLLSISCAQGTGELRMHFSRWRQRTQRRTRTALGGVSFCKYPTRQRSAVLGKRFLEDSDPP